MMSVALHDLDRPRALALGRLSEIGFAALGSFIYGTQAVQMLLGSADQAVAGRPIAVHITFSILYALTILILFSDFRFVKTLLRHRLIVALLVFPFISVLWSVRPADSLQRSVAGFGSGLFGLYLFWRFGLTVAVRILAVAMTCAAVGSLFTALFLPKVGLMVDETWAGAWRGLYFHKNSLGAAIALASVLLVYVILTDTPIFRVMALFGLGICALLLLGSRSMTALFVTVTCLSLVAWARGVQRSANRYITLSLITLFSLVLILVVLLSFASLEDAFVILGKKAGMSGRFPLWEQVIYFIRQRPILGYGYEAFWAIDATETRLIAAVIRYTPFYSHNGALEIMLTGGLVLAALVIAFLVIFVRNAWCFARRYPNMLIATLPLVFFGFLLLADISESHLLMRNDLIWSLAVGLAMRVTLAEKMGSGG